MANYTDIFDNLICVKSNILNSNKRRICDDFSEILKNLPQKERETVLSSPSIPDRFRIDFSMVKEHFKYIPLDPTITDKYKKNNDISTEFFNCGDSFYQNKFYLEAVKFYNQAIVFTEVFNCQGQTSSQLIKAYIKRSVALSDLGLTDEALEDIHLALSLTLSSDDLTSQEQAMKLKTNLEAKIKERINRQNFETKLKNEITNRTAYCEKMFILQSPNSLAPSLEDSVDIRWDSSHGRHLVANKDIPIGTTVLVERPFAAVLMNSLTWVLDHCHHCLKQNFRCIPCPNCVFTLYCNEKCRTEAEEYHQYECPCIPELQCVLGDEREKGQYFLLAFKLICLMGPQKLFKIFNEWKETKESRRFFETLKNSGSDYIAGSDPNTGVYSPNSYSAMLNLVTSEALEVDYNSILLSLILSHTLDNSNFFTFLNNSDKKTEFQDFIAELIHHHSQTIPKNGFVFGGFSSTDHRSLRVLMERMDTMEEEAKSMSIPARAKQDIFLNCKSYDSSMGIFATASLINHSCDPNAITFFGKQFGTVALVIIKSLKKGQELLISYGPFFGSVKEEDKTAEGRRDILRTRYSFECHCVACEYNWVGSEDLVAAPVFSCSVCAAKFSHEDKMSQEFQNCILSSSNNFKCKLCGFQYLVRGIWEDYDSHCKKLELCKKLIFDNRPLEAVEDIKAAMRFFEVSVCPPNFRLVDAFNLFNEANNVINMF